MKGKPGLAVTGGAPLLSIGVPVLLLFYFFTPQRPVQFITFFLVFLILGSKLYSEYLLRHLCLVRRDGELRVFRYEWIGVELWAENRGRLPAFLLALGDFSGGVAVFRDIKCVCTLGGKSRQLFRWEAYGSDRGVYSLGPAVIRGSDPLGLFPFTLTMEEKARLFVYPAQAIAALKTPGGIPLGNLVTPDPFNEDLTRPRSLRDYTPGDESRRINWKASAKNSSLLVNEYESSLSYPLVIFLNVDIGEYAIKKRELYIERVIEAAAALCLMAARERQALGLIVHSAAEQGSVEQGSAVISPAAFTQIPVLERLAALEPFKTSAAGTANILPEEGGAASPEKTPGALRRSTESLLEKGKLLPFGARLIYVGPALEEEDYHALETLKKRRLSLEYLIVDEKNLEFNHDQRGTGASRKYQMKERGNAIF